jgi:hypothetical protein
MRANCSRGCLAARARQVRETRANFRQSDGWIHRCFVGRFDGDSNLAIIRMMAKTTPRKRKSSMRAYCIEFVDSDGDVYASAPIKAKSPEHAEIVARTVARGLRYRVSNASQ